MATLNEINLGIHSFSKFVDPVIEITDQWRVVSLNSAAENLFELTHSQVAGRLFEDVFELEKLGFCYPDIRKAIELEDWWRGETSYTCNDGRKYWFVWSVFRSNQNDDSKSGLLVHARDISGQKQSASDHQKLINIIEFLPDATFVLDSEKRVIAWNRAIEEMTGVPKDKIIGQKDHAYSVPFYGERRPIVVDLIDIDTAVWESCYDFVEQRGNTFFAEVYVPSLYNGRGAHIWVTASPLFDEAGNRIGAIESVRDITARKQAETDLQKRNEELSVQAKMLEETNTALKVLLHHKDKDRSEMEQKVHANMKKLVNPNIDRLKGARLSPRQSECIDLIESNLNEVLSPFISHLSDTYNDLTPKEIEVANLIKSGKTSKEIAEFLRISEDGIKFHRHNIRKKLHLNGKKANLRSHLMGMA